MKPMRISSLAALLITACAARAAGNLFPDPDFTLQNGAWELPDSAIVDDGGGVAVLKTWRTDPARYFPTAVCNLKLKPGTYLVGCLVRGEELKDGAATIAVELFGGGQFIHGGAYPHGVNGTTGWMPVDDLILVPEGCDTVSFRFYLRQGATGTAYFKEPYVIPVATDLAEMLKPAMPSLLEPGRQEFVFAVFGDAHAARMTYRVDGEAAASGRAAIAGRRLSFTLDLVEADSAALEIELVLPDGSVVKLDPIDLGQVAAKAPPTNAVLIDDRGRAWVDGKKFFPLGLYDNSADPRGYRFAPDFDTTVKLLADSPFNCLMAYDTIPHFGLGLGMRGTGREGVESLDYALDQLAANGLRIIFSLKDFRGDSVAWHGTQGEFPIMERIIERYKDHPALLAWYMVDEDSPGKRQHNINRRRFVNRLDPWHPTWSVFYDFSANLDLQAGVTEIYGVDPYPVGRGEDFPFGVEAAMTGARKAFGFDGGMALWGVPQIFSWSVYFNSDDLELHPYPTEKEMRSMCLAMLEGGAKGIVMYAWVDLFAGADAGQFERRWPEICRVGETMLEMAPYVLGDPPGPAVRLDVEAGKVFASGFTSDDGGRAVIVAAMGPGASKARLRIDAAGEFRSLYGNSLRQPDGTWLFTGDGIDSDVLVSE